jgi:hypothetical protein
MNESRAIGVPTPSRHASAAVHSRVVAPVASTQRLPPEMVALSAAKLPVGVNSVSRSVEVDRAAGEDDVEWRRRRNSGVDRLRLVAVEPVAQVNAVLATRPSHVALRVLDRVDATDAGQDVARRRDGQCTVGGKGALIDVADFEICAAGKDDATLTFAALAAPAPMAKAMARAMPVLLMIDTPLLENDPKFPRTWVRSETGAICVPVGW